MPIIPAMFSIDAVRPVSVGNSSYDLQTGAVIQFFKFGSLTLASKTLDIQVVIREPEGDPNLYSWDYSRTGGLVAVESTTQETNSCPFSVVKADIVSSVLSVTFIRRERQVEYENDVLFVDVTVWISDEPEPHPQTVLHLRK